MTNKQAIKTILSWLVVALIFFLIGKNIVKNYNEIKDHLKELDFMLLGLAFFVLFLPMFFLTYLWQAILKSMGLKLTYNETFSIYFIGNLGKYIPGKIWQFFMMAYMAKDKGLSAGKAFSAAFVGQMLSITAGILIAFVTIGFSFKKYIANPIYIVSFILFICFILTLFIKPQLVEKSGNLIAKKLGRASTLKLEFNPKKLVIFISAYSVIWVLVGVSFFIICRSLINVGLEKLPFTIGAFSASVVIGFLTLFAPGGIGVREGLITILLPKGEITTPTIASIISIIARLIFTLNEIALFGIALAFRSKEERNEQKETKLS